MRLELTTSQALVAIAVELLVLAVAFFVLRARGWSAERLGLQFSGKAVAAGIPLFIMYLLLSMVTSTLVLQVWPGARDVLPFRSATTAPAGLVMLFLVAHALLEETVVTASVIAALERHGAATAILASTLLRFACHLYLGPLAAIGIVPVGLVFGLMFWRWRNVWPLIVADALANVVAFAMMPGR